MKKTVRFRISFLFLSLISLFCLSCTSLIPIRMSKPAEIPMHNYKNVVVADITLPSMNVMDMMSNESVSPLQKAAIVIFNFDSLFTDPDEVFAGREFKREIRNTLLDTGYFTLYEMNSVLNTHGDYSEQQIYTDLKNRGIEAVILGSILFLEEDYDQEWVIVDDQDVRRYSKTVSLGFQYQIIDTQNSRIVATRNFRDSRSDRSYDRDNLDSTKDMIETMIYRMSDQMAYQLVPRKVTEYRVLKGMDNDHPQYVLAFDYVEEEQYLKAFEVFTKIFTENDDLEAAYNGVIMLEASGQLENAVEYLEAILSAYPTQEFRDELHRINRRIEEERLANL